ncbi:O-antigen ligase family protein [Cucumibacter marinus]|uniref:O-antigen ligase family protein n=1 Tax=Cucumibacter marinus TaxID=1121252 RepID=UPI00041F3030|nr:O-antigen ligase family protein [Cucumibacter marinus]
MSHRAIFGWLFLPVATLSLALFNTMSAYVLMLMALLAPLVVPGLAPWRAAWGNIAVKGFILAFGLVGLASGLRAVVAGDVEALSALVNFLPFALAPLAAMAIVQAGHANASRWLSILSLLAVLAGFAVGLEQALIEGARRSSGFDDNPIWLGDFAVLFGFLAATGVFAFRPVWRFLFLAGPAIAVVTVVLSGTRGAALAYAAGLVVFAGFSAIALRRHPGRWPVLGIAAVAIVGAALIAVPRLDLDRFTAIPSLITTGLTEGATEDRSANHRLEFLKAGAGAFAQSPVYGHGWNAKFSAAEPMMAEFARQENDGAGFMHLHNDPLNFAVGLGLIGLLGYAVVMLAPLIAVWQSPRDSQFFQRSYAMVSLVAIIGAAGMTDSMFQFEAPKVLYVTMAMIILFGLRDEPVRPAPRIETG